MAEAAAARREARRKRILENSHNRLQLISGKPTEECARESPVRTVIPEALQEKSVATDHHINSCNSRSSLNNGVIPSELETFDFLSSLNHDIPSYDIAAGDSEVSSNLVSPIESIIQEPTQSQTIWVKMANYRYDIVLLSFIIQLMYSVSLVTFDEGTYFFLPVIIYSITKLIWFPSQSNSKLSSALMLIQGMSSYKVQKVMWLTQLVGVISRDICIFLFTTICIQSLLITLKNGLIT